MPDVRVGECTIYVVDRKVTDSAYPPLILVHGAGGSHLDWPPALHRLPDVRVLALDLPGHRRSDGLGYADTLAYAEAVIGLLDALGITRAIIAGHSMGGAVAQQMAIHWPERVAGLVLIGTGSKLPVAPDLPDRIVNAPEATVEWIVAGSWSADAPLEVKARSRAQLLHTPPGVLRGDYLACQAFDVRQQLGRIAVPTLILYASEDRMVTPKFSMTLGERIAGSKLVRIEGAGHMLPLEQPEAVAVAVCEWLEDQIWAG